MHMPPSAVALHAPVPAFSYSGSLAMFRSSARMGLLAVNDALAQMFGFASPSEATAVSITSLYVKQEDRKAFVQQMEKQGRTEDFVVQLRRLNGSQFWGSISAMKTRDEYETGVYVGVIRDVSEEIQRESQKQYQEKWQAMLLTISADFMNSNFRDATEILDSAMAACAHLLSVDRMQIHNYDFGNNACVAKYEWCAKGIASTLNKYGSVSMSEINEMLKRHVKGEPMVIADVNDLPNGISKQILLAQKIKSLITIPLMADGNCTGFVSFDNVRAIRQYSTFEVANMQLFAGLVAGFMQRTEREKKLQTLVERTAVQNRRLKEFSFITSHNIRASVANLLVLKDFIQQDPANPKFQRMLETQVRKLDVGIRDINDILDLENAVEANEMIKCNVASSIARVLKWHRNIMQQRGIVLINKLPRNVKVLAIPSYLDSIFNQLLSNAIKYGTDAEHRTIELDLRKRDDKIAVLIRDFGQGIDLERHGSRLFRAGTRFHEESCDAMGMGLFLANYQVGSLGGRIRIDSQVGKGTTVEISFLK